jgi:cytochrome c-type biogenesis protein CcmH/NrfF
MAQRKQTIAILVVGVGSILIGYLLGYTKGYRYGRNLNRGQVAGVSSPQPLSPNPSNPTLDLRTAEIIKELNCVCGCKMELAPCTCDEKRGAQEIRSFVQALIQQQISRPEIINRLVEKYGETILIKKT